MIRLLLSVLALALFTAPGFAQEDELPPLPTRAEVLAEIEAQAAELDVTSNALGDVLDVWEYEPSLDPASRRIAIRMGGVYAAELANNPAEARLITSPVERLIEADEFEQAWELFEQMEEVRAGRPIPRYESQYRGENNVLSHLAFRFGRTDIGSHYIEVNLAIGASSDDRSRHISDLSNAAFDAFFFRNDPPAYEQFMRRALVRVFQDPEWETNEDRWVVADALEIELHAGHEEFLEPSLELRHRWGQADDEQFVYLVQSARSAIGRLNLSLTRRLLDRSLLYLPATGRGEREEILAAAILYARLGECEAAESLVEYTQLQRRISEAEYRLETAARQHASRPKQNFAEDDRIILVHRRYRPFEREAGQRALIALECGSPGAAAEMLLDSSWGQDIDGMMFNVHGIEGGLHDRSAAQLLRLEIGRRLPTERFVRLARAAFNDRNFAIELAYLAYLLHSADGDAVALQSEVWRHVRSDALNTEERLEALAWLALALPE